MLTVVPAGASSNLRLEIETDGKVVTSMRAGKSPEVETVLGCL